MTQAAPPPRSIAWTWGLCLVLFSGTLLNYANRFAFNQNATPIKEAFGLNDETYGGVNSWFAIGFALGGLLFGVLADWLSVRWLFPFVVIAFSAASAACGLVETVLTLSILQFLVALFEAGHWPCSLRTTQRNFKPAMRTLGNSILQSGASVGAVLTPLLVLAIITYRPDQWRWAFFIVGGMGVPWAIAWLLMVREDDLRRPVIQTNESTAGPGDDQELQEIPFWQVFLTRRWWLLLIVVCGINLVWHYIRVWLPIWLVDERGYSEAFLQKFTAVYYIVTFVGAIAAGRLTHSLSHSGWNVHTARMTVFLGCAVLAAFVIPAEFLPRGPLFLGALLCVAFGSLGLFPIYYSLNQEISARHQGKVGGTLAFSTWGLLFFFHDWVGRVLERTPDYKPWIVTAIGLGPLAAYLVLLTCWGRRPGSGS